MMKRLPQAAWLATLIPLLSSARPAAAQEVEPDLTGAYGLIDA